MCLAVAELSVQWKFITLGPIWPGTNTELGSGANQVCLAIAKLSVQWKFITLGPLRLGTNTELGSGAN